MLWKVGFNIFKPWGDTVKNVCINEIWLTIDIDKKHLYRKSVTDAYLYSIFTQGDTPCT